MQILTAEVLQEDHPLLLRTLQELADLYYDLVRGRSGEGGGGGEMFLKRKGAREELLAAAIDLYHLIVAKCEQVSCVCVCVCVCVRARARV